MSPPQPSRVDPKIWRACAGAAVQIPKLHSRVYYFPQGHMEHASPSHYLSPLIRSLPFVPCHVSSLDFLADPFSDEVFAKFLLTPLSQSQQQPFQNDNKEARNDDDDEDRENNGVVSFAKILTPSDANNGGGFSVPRFCADSCFPPLDFRADPPVQLLSVADIHGVEWRFRHIYRGTPRRHLFTTGWSKFVNHKKLVAGDTVVFVKDSDGSVSVGIRRAARFAAAIETPPPAEREGFSRSTTGRVTAEAVAAAAESAARNAPFEVVYYPRTGFADFVVSAEVVEESMKCAWVGGMRVKISMETEDSSRMTWYQGTVSSACASENGPWRMLQVNWDEPEVLQNAKQVSPWQVELVSPPFALHTVFSPNKRLRADQGSGLLSNREQDPFFPMPGFSNSAMGHMTGFPNSTVGQMDKPLLSYESFPAGMQGARHDLYSPLSFSNFLNDNSYLYMGSGSFGNNPVQSLGTVTTELNMSSSQSDDLSPHSQSSFHSFGTEFTGTRNCDTKVGPGSILLFGKIIQPAESDLHDADCMERDGSRGSNKLKTVEACYFSK
ncbi:auxin response factor 17-like [Glycine soja]|uniref:Auxin response factor n=1 Tax=Glycine soja TaxID=3848 RepID=A0A445HCU9_GLYSO|nr:auxin response factor 17-like [Glycine soja]RZB71463.1 Auxin response factor 17 isoform A [Glycine soja]RZB71464.1 Auxin response factor 17 isoform B [Glycine soja]